MYVICFEYQWHLCLSTAQINHQTNNQTNNKRPDRGTFKIVQEVTDWEFWLITGVQSAQWMSCPTAAAQVLQISSHLLENPANYMTSEQEQLARVLPDIKDNHGVT